MIHLTNKHRCDCLSCRAFAKAEALSTRPILALLVIVGLAVVLGVELR